MFPGHIGSFPVSRVPDISIHVLSLRLFFFLLIYALKLLLSFLFEPQSQNTEPGRGTSIHSRRSPLTTSLNRRYFVWRLTDVPSYSICVIL